MTVTGRDVVIAVVFLVIGWVLKTLYEALMDWLYDAFGMARGLVWDLCAVAGIVAVCLAFGYLVTHHTHIPTG